MKTQNKGRQIEQQTNILKGILKAIQHFKLSYVHSMKLESLNEPFKNDLILKVEHLQKMLISVRNQNFVQSSNKSTDPDKGNLWILKIMSVNSRRIILDAIMKCNTEAFKFIVQTNFMINFINQM